MLEGDYTDTCGGQILLSWWRLWFDRDNISLFKTLGQLFKYPPLPEYIRTQKKIPHMTNFLQIPKPNSLSPRITSLCPRHWDQRWKLVKETSLVAWIAKLAIIS